MNCPFCGSELKQTGGGYIAIHFVCTTKKCGAWWPEEDRTDESALKIWNAEQAYKRSMILPGSGGNDPTGKAKKKNEGKGVKVWLDE